MPMAEHDNEHRPPREGPVLGKQSRARRGSAPDGITPPRPMEAAGLDLEECLDAARARLVEAFRFAAVLGDDLPDGEAVISMQCPFECTALITVTRAAEAPGGVFVMNPCGNVSHWWAFHGLNSSALAEVTP